jgi:hypothetical protein
MVHRQGGHKTTKLVFPSNWTGKWLFRAIINTPKWQINSVLNSYKYNQWISFESTYLNGLQLPEKTSPEENWIRSVIVGMKVSQASKDYEQMMNKVPLEDKVELLKSELATPIIGDMIRSLTTFVAPMPSPMEEKPNLVKVEFPKTQIKEVGKMTPVIVNG